MRGSLPAHASVILVLLGWSVVTTVRERLGIRPPAVEAPPPSPRPPFKAAPAARREPAWIRIN